MSYMINNNCINCSACSMECPENAIYSHKTRKKDIQRISKMHFFIISSRCNECDGISSLPLCIEICPMKCIIKLPGKKRNRNI